MAGFPIRKSPDQSLYTATRGLSQCPTSFIGTWRQGIHRKLLVAYLRDTEKSKLLAFFFYHYLRLGCCFFNSNFPIQFVRYLPVVGYLCAERIV